MAKLAIGVLMGGRSLEREVSLSSGRTLCDHLDSDLYDIVPLFETFQGALYILPWKFLYQGKTTDFVDLLPNQAELLFWDDLKERVDLVYIAQHGRYGEDGCMQGLLEVLNIPYVGSGVYASAMGMDKFFQKDLLSQAGIGVASDIRLLSSQVNVLVEDDRTCEAWALDSRVTFPCVIKPRNEGSSIGVCLVKTLSELKDALAYASSGGRDILIEPKLEGMEFSQILLTDRSTGQLFALPPTEVVPDTHTLIWDYEQKYMPGRSTKFTPARVSLQERCKIAQVCLSAANILSLANFARIDGFLTPAGQVVIIDVNTLAGMAPSSFMFKQAAHINMSHPELINHLIETELDRRGHFRMEQNRQKESLGGDYEKKRIAVLMGGSNAERETSLDSGRNVFYKIAQSRYHATPFFLDRDNNLYELDQNLLVCNTTREIEQGLTREQRWFWSSLPDTFDFVFIALHGGIGENGSVQGMLEMLGLPYNGSSVLTSALCMDKYRTTSFLRGKGFDVPSCSFFSRSRWLHDREALVEDIACRLGFPVIIKPHDDGCSYLVLRAGSRDELYKQLDHYFLHEKDEVLVEELVNGMELTVGAYGNEEIVVLPPSYAVAVRGILSMQEKFLPGGGSNVTPAPLPQAALGFVMKTIERCYGALECKGYARIDCFYQSPDQSPTGAERVIIFEVNTLPALTPATCLFHQAACVGMRPKEFITQVIELGFAEHKSARTSVVRSVLQDNLMQPVKADQSSGSLDIP